MPDLPATIASRLSNAFGPAADADRAAGARSYMRGQFEFYGIAAPGQRAIWRDATSDLPPPNERELVRVANTCWAEPQREWQYFACGYLRRHAPGKSSRLLPAVGKLIRTKSWWDTVDSLAAHTVGTIVAEHPEIASTMDEWSRSSDIWIARTAILHQLGYKSRTDSDRLFAYCLARAGDKEFFIRKAIGWALREYSKTNERAVRAFVHEHEDTLAPLSRVEALKWLNRRAARGI